MQESGIKTEKIRTFAEGADFMREFMELADVESSVGEPVTEGGKTVIPLAEVGAILGFGFGGSVGADESTGNGGGGGGYISTRPVAAIIIEEGQVRVEPIFDATKVMIAFVSALAAIFMAVLRMRRVQEALEA